MFFETIFMLYYLLPLADKEVAGLINDLGHDKFIVRQRATDKLIEMGERPIFQVRLGAMSRDLEVKHRCDRVIEAYYSVKPSKYAHIPYIDMLPENYPDRSIIQNTYLPRGYAACGDRPENQTPWQPPFERFWPAYRLATVLYVRDQMEQGRWKKADAVKFLDTMVPIEKAYLKKFEDEYKKRIEAEKANQPPRQ